MKNPVKTNRNSNINTISRNDLASVVGGHLVGTSTIELPDGRTYEKSVYKTEGGGREVVVTVS